MSNDFASRADADAWGAGGAILSPTIIKGEPAADEWGTDSEVIAWWITYFIACLSGYFMISFLLASLE